MVATKVLRIVWATWLLTACGDESACSNEKSIADNIASHAKLDGISAKGLCALSQEEIATRLKGGSVWSHAIDADRESRAQQYVTNCGKLSQAKADCGD